MVEDRPTCSGRKADGTPCQSTIVDPETGRCLAHQPGGKSKLRAAGRRGGKVAAARLRVERGLVEDLPPLQTMDDARLWLEQIIRGVLVGQITPEQMQAARQGLLAWIDAQRDKQVLELRQQIEELKRLRTA